jgi:hypothetical protein
MSRERELQGESRKSLTSIYQRVQEFSDQLPKSEEYRKVISEFDNGQLESFPPGTLPTVDFYMKRGIASSIMTIELLALISDPLKHHYLLREFDEGIIPDHWIEETVIQRHSQRTGITDIYGLETLAVIKQRDMANILKKISSGLDEQQEKGYRHHADVVGRGHDFIISKYKEELEASGLLTFQS